MQLCGLRIEHPGPLFARPREYVAWVGVFAPGTTRPELVARINALLHEAVDSPDTRDRLRIQGVEPQIQSLDQFREKVKRCRGGGVDDAAEGTAGDG